MHYFFELIQVAVGKRCQLSGIPTAEEWELLYGLSKKQALQGVLYEGMLKLPVEQRPGDLLTLKWYGVAEKIRKKNTKMNAACVAMSKEFQEDGRRHAILKGQGVACLYPDPLARVSGDIDVWLDGSRKDILDYMGKKTKLGTPIFHHVDVDLKDDTRVEIHFIPAFLFAFVPHRRLLSYFQRVADREFNHKVDFKDINGESYRIPISTLAFNRVFILIHIYDHFFGLGIGFRQFLDYYYVLNQGVTEEERLEAVEVLKSLHLLKFAAATMYVLQTVFGLEKNKCLTEPNEKEGKFLLSEIIKAGNFGNFDKRLNLGHLNVLQRGIRLIKRNSRFFFSYPEQVISAPIFKVYMYWWLSKHRWG